MDKKTTRFYKYHSNNTNLHKLLKNNSLWFSSRKELNDLLEGRFIISENYSLETIKEAADIFLTEMKLKLPLFYQIDSDKFFDIVYNILRDKLLFNNFNSNLFYSDRVLEWFACCFTSKFDNPAMWAHYADDNKGVCLEFDFSEDNSLLEKIHKVQYEEDIPYIQSDNDILKTPLIKMKDWEYENEWRIISDIGGPKKFNKECLKAVYFGVKSSPFEIQIVVDLCKKYNYKNVVFRKVSVSNFKI